MSSSNPRDMTPRQRDELKRVLLSIESGKDDDDDNEDTSATTTS